MAVTWKIYDGTTTQSLAAWGIDSIVLARANLAVETLSFSIPVADIYADPVFAYDQTLHLIRDDGVSPITWFIGKVKKLPAFAGPQERQRYVVANAWAEFERIIYQQRYVVPDPSAPGLLGSWSTRVVLGQDRWGRAQTAHAVITEITNYANSVGGGLATISSLPTLAVPPAETVRDITCAEAIRRMVGYAPDAVGYFAYHTGTPVLVIAQRGALTPLTLDLDDKDKIEVIDGLSPLHEIKARGVVLIFQKTAASLDGSIKISETRQAAGARTGPGVIFATIQLGDHETVPAGLATQYYNSLATLEWEGTLRLHERECTAALRPGYVLNLDNGRTAWAAMNATVQSTAEELLTGVTTVQIGAAEHLGLSDFVDMMRRFRNRNARTSFADTQHNGTAGTCSQVGDTDPSDDPLGPSCEHPDDPPEPNPDGGSPAIMPTVDVQACVDGETKTLRLAGYSISGGGGGPL